MSLGNGGYNRQEGAVRRKLGFFVDPQQNLETMNVYAINRMPVSMGPLNQATFAQRQAAIGPTRPTQHNSGYFIYKCKGGQLQYVFPFLHSMGNANPQLSDITYKIDFNDKCEHKTHNHEGVKPYVFISDDLNKLKSIDKILLRNSSDLQASIKQVSVLLIYMSNSPMHQINKWDFPDGIFKQVMFTIMPSLVEPWRVNYFTTIVEQFNKCAYEAGNLPPVFGKR